MIPELKNIIDFIENNHGKDISAYSSEFLQNSVSHRINELKLKNIPDYIDYISLYADEIQIFINSLTISYSSFFRNSLDFSLLEQFVFPELLSKNKENNGLSFPHPEKVLIRIWSAGCAGGQEPYSLLMLADNLITEQFKKNSADKSVLIFGTDSSDAALKKAEKGIYDYNAVRNTKQLYIDKYFTKSGEMFAISDNIKNKIDFSNYDMLDIKSTSPPPSIYGGFDVVFCSNVMLYYKTEIQHFIMSKLCTSLNCGGYLIVGESEKAIVKPYKEMKLLTQYGNIFVKR